MNFFKLAIVSTLAIFALSSCTSEKAVTLEGEDQKTLYAMGNAISSGRYVPTSFADLNLSAGEIAALVSGLKDGIAKTDPKIDVKEQTKKISAFLQSKSKAIAEQIKKAALPYLAKMKGEPGATVTKSGIIIRDIKPGTGKNPVAEDKVKVHYHGTLVDGTVFDSSVQRKQPATIPLNSVIPCWREAVQKIKVGGKSKVTCPSETAYGDRGAPPNIKPGSVLTFEIELLEIEKGA